MVSEDLPRFNAQAALYGRVLAAARHARHFPTLDLGGDKVLPYLEAEREDNPALGWRAVRMGLDRPALLRLNSGRSSPRWPEDLFGSCFRWSPASRSSAPPAASSNTSWPGPARGRPAPSRLEVGAMIERRPCCGTWTRFADDRFRLGGHERFLMQYLFAADRGNPRVCDRYDSLSPPALRALRAIREACEDTGTPVSVCGEMAGRPLEAFALVALGFDQLSMPPAGIGAGQADGPFLRPRSGQARCREPPQEPGGLGSRRNRSPRPQTLRRA